MFYNAHLAEQFSVTLENNDYGIIYVPWKGKVYQGSTDKQEELQKQS